jgi:hypothetical protein
MTSATEEFSVPPSLLSRKILCSAFVPQPFDPATRLRFLGLHAMATVAVIRRHIMKGYTLRSIERAGRGFRLDLLFADLSGKVRLVEVKSSRIIKQVHKIQAALYWRPNIDEIVVSNREIDHVLTNEFVFDVAEKAEETLRLLQNDPGAAAATFTPNSECYICANKTCPWLRLGKALNAVPRKDA